MKSKRQSKRSSATSTASSTKPALALAPEDHALDVLDEASAPLPFLDQIASSFGEHDVSGVAFAGDAGAEDAAGGIGARAYASGEAVAAPGAGLFETAHEAAHVVQQRGSGGGSGVDETPGREDHANRVAAAVVAGEDASGLLGEVSQPGQGQASPGRIERLKDHSSGTPVDVPLTSLSETEVLGYIADMELNGEVHKLGTNIEYEKGDLVRLKAIRDQAGFGAASIAAIDSVLSSPPAEVAAAATDRRISPAVIADFQALFGRMSSHASITGFGEWAASKMPYITKLTSATTSERASGAQSLLDFVNELREYEVMLIDLPDGQRINIAEAPIENTKQTADATTSGGLQVEVKTVRKPVTGPGPITSQIGEAVGKFAAVTGTGPYEGAVYASWDPAVTTSTSTDAEQGGDTTRGTDRTRGAGSFVNKFEPATGAKKPAFDASKTLKDSITKYLNGTVAGTDKAHKVTVRMENPADNGKVDSYVFKRAGSKWSAS